MKILLSVIEEESGYRAVINRGENPEPPAGKPVILSLNKEIERTGGYDNAKVRAVTKELKKKAGEILRKMGINHVINLTPDPYPLERR